MGEHEFLFYLPEFSTEDTTIRLDGDEHHHLARVLRLSAGDEIHVTNGAGLMSRARLDEVSASGATAQITETSLQPRGLCAVAIPLIKKDRFELALEQCVELGVSRCIPFVSERCHLRAFSGAYLERLRRIAVSAMKQSFHAWLPAVETPVSFDGLLARLDAFEHCVFGHPGGEPAGPVPGEVLVVVGPEGGLTEDEAGAMREAGARALSLGPHRLRAGTAAAVLVAAVRGTD